MEEIEVLDFDDKKDKKIKEKKSIRKCEKIFLFINILVILTIIGIYAYRVFYYYNETHNINENITLKEKLTSVDNIVYQKDGLYEKDNIFFYKGEEVNNYVYYSGRMFRIIGINDGIKMIEEDGLTNIISGINSKYDESMIYQWLKDYLNTLKDYEIYLKTSDYCNESIDIENYSCSNKLDEYIGLLDIKEYLNAGGKNSYLNNNTYFWTINYDKDNKFFYVNDEGSINNINNKEDNYFSYGIRPVITLKEDVLYIKGSGIIYDPYIIEEADNALLKDNGIGS